MPELQDSRVAAAQPGRDLAQRLPLRPSPSGRGVRVAKPGLQRGRLTPPAPTFTARHGRRAASVGRVVAPRRPPSRGAPRYAGRPRSSPRRPRAPTRASSTWAAASRPRARRRRPLRPQPCQHVLAEIELGHQTKSHGHRAVLRPAPQAFPALRTTSPPPAPAALPPPPPAVAAFGSAASRAAHRPLPAPERQAGPAGLGEGDAGAGTGHPSPAPLRAPFGRRTQGWEDWGLRAMGMWLEQRLPNYEAL